VKQALKFASGYKTIAIAAALVAVVVVYGTFDPATHPFPKCFFKLVTGWDCPGCGSQRALHALLMGRVGEAWAFNPYVFFAVPAAFFFGIVEAFQVRWPRLHRAVIRPSTYYGLILFTIIWTFVRNMM